MKTQKMTKEEINNESESLHTIFPKKFLAKKHHIFIVSAIVISILSFGGYFYYGYSAKQIRAEKENDLQAITALKNNQLVQWRKERVGDAKIISGSSFFANGIEEWLTDRYLNQLSNEILEQLRSAITNYGYEDIFLVSTAGELYLSVLQNLKEIDIVTKTKILQIANRDEITFTDLYYCPSHHTIHYDIIAPVKNNNNSIIAFLVFRINPSEFLYPLIQSWPLPSKSGELLLVRKDGDSVLFLNELRHQKNTALQLRIPLARKDLPASQAILGKTGIFNGKDYRGIEVVACLAHVPDTEWFMVSKVDRNEIFSEVNTRGFIVSILIILLVLTLTIGMAWIYNFRQKKIYKNLWLFQEEYRTILYSIGDAVIITDINGCITNINKVAESLTGWEEKNAIGKKLITVFNIINEVTRTSVEDPVNKVLRSGHIVGLANHTVLISKNGAEFQIADSAAPIINVTGEIKGVVLVFSDVTDKYAAQKRLKESEERFNLAMKASNDGVFDWNLETNEIYYSPGWKRMLGYEDNELPNDFSVWENTTKNEDVKKSWEQQQKLVTKQIERFVLEFKMKHKDGHFVDILSKAEAIFNENGKAVRIVGTHTDITDRKQAEEKLEESEDKYRALFENAPLPYQSLNEDGSFKDVNPAWLSTLGYKRDEIVGKFYKDFLHPDWRNHFEINFPAFKKRGYVKDVQFKIRHKKGYYLDISFEGCIGYNRDGSFKQTYCVFQDITYKKQAEEALKTAKEKAEESDRLKSAFLANMSHEIRTPMNGILGFAELLKEPGLTGEKQGEYIRIIENAGTRMLNIINDIVNISKIESGQMEINMTDSDINEQIEYIYSFFKPNFDKKSIQFSYKISLPSNEAIIKTDREKLFAILTNLVKNAIKYTEKGFIEFGYTIKEKQLEFYVKDTGVGIDSDRQVAIFERFIQADISDKMALQGAGLGLAISKAYVEMLGGKIWVESKKGEGSIFYFTMPYRNGNAKEIVEPRSTKIERNQVNNLKILIADDDEASNQLMAVSFKEFADEIITVFTGKEAIEECKINPNIDLILMDIQMPVINGYEATRQIRAFNKEVIIIAQTAFALSGDREKSIAAGCNDYISKPLRKDELEIIIQKYFEKNIKLNRN